MKKHNSTIHVKVLSISTSIIAIFIIVNLFTFSTNPGTNNSRLFTFSDSYNIFSLDIPEEITFAGEKVPLEKHWVKESFDRELLINTYWQSQTLLFIKRSNRYFPIIEPILKAEGVPDDFKYLAVIESSLMPRSLSPAGAAGLWQFMPTTAKEYGLEVNDEVDERYHIEKSTIAACDYLKKSYETFQDWTLVAASYNAGKKGVSTQLDKQKAESYYNLLLGEETGRYVYRIIAVKEILSDPEKYGFHVNDEDKYQAIATKTVSFDSAITDIADYASAYGISYKEFKDLNPWLRDNVLSNRNKKSYQFYLPKEARLILQDNQRELSESTPQNSLNTNLQLKKQELSIQ